MPDHAPQISGDFGVDDDPKQPDDSYGQSVEDDGPDAYLPDGDGDE